MMVVVEFISRGRARLGMAKARAANAVVIIFEPSILSPLMMLSVCVIEAVERVKALLVRRTDELV